MVYNKLVRDKIPEIILSKGEQPHIRTFYNDEYILMLNKKLDEEAAEYKADNNMEEPADILEVIYALGNTIGSADELMAVYERKHKERGGFDKKILLISKD